ncbi:hypothetical protein DFH08DRAFT_734608 [Mycena albidolilacea]|uniref:Novel STAND NTPase 1 domain-containing protein n=1 Tax=Mycena albidolilacea TaxID=1033008 RepID=A0AAD7AIQ2_9AGAR|nr:hypothetical protein DFH08DRAFT_734608 [Mycena albidolilacea]
MIQKSPDTVDKILQYTLVAANTLREAVTASQIPFLHTVCALSLAVIPLVQTTKFHKAQCFEIMDQIHRLLCALTSLCFHSEDIRSPKMLDQIAQFVLTLQKFQSCLKAQSGLGTIKRLFKQSEIAAQLECCQRELAAAHRIFTLKYGVGIVSALLEMNIGTEERHQELLELISCRSGSFASTSSMDGNSFNASSDSFSLLPASPSIFHGRESELESLVNTLVTDSASVAILGPGGIGKTTLARATLHHPAVIEKYASRHFISCESANTRDDLLASIGSHLGLEPSKQLSKTILSHLRQSESCLILLDNFETPWERTESRSQVEEFLSLLSAIPNLALLITMRGAERPGKVKWHRPFLPPLEPLSSCASRQIFLDIADEPGTGEESALNDLLDLSGSLPLAVSLMANIASFEGYLGTLRRWRIENTTLLSDGHDKRSNLEKSINLSLGSPRLASSPHAKALLSLLSLLPDGIRAEDIMASKVPIPNVRRWQSLLVGTSLAYIDAKGRLKALSPIREYIRRVHPPPHVLSSPLRTYFQDLIELWGSKRELPSNDLAPALATFLGNINELLLEGLLSAEKPTRIEIAHTLITLDSFSTTMLKGKNTLFQRLPRLIEETGDAGLRWKYVGRCLSNSAFLIENAEDDIKEGVRYFATETHTPSQAVRFYRAAAFYYLAHGSARVDKAKEFTELALSLARQTGDIELQLLSLEVEFNVAHTCDDPYWAIAVSRKARKIAQFMTNYWEFRCTQWEAWGACHSGNLRRAVDLCAHGEEVLISDGMEGSDRYLQFLDIRGDVNFMQTNYIESRRIFKQIVDMTAPTRSPFFHAYSLTMIAHIDIITECEVPGILESINAAHAVYTAQGHKTIPVCLRLNAELQLYRGDIQNARSGLIACLSRGPVQQCLAALGDPKNGMNGTFDTFRWAVVYLAFERKQKGLVGTLNAIRCLADIFAAFGDEETALNLYHAALEGGTKMGVHRLRAECMVGIGGIMLRRGDAMQARAMWVGAHPLFLCSRRRRDAVSVHERLQRFDETAETRSVPVLM